jgi:hypothetical protein
LFVASAYNQDQIRKLETMHAAVKTSGNNATITYPSVSNGTAVMFVLRRASSGWQIARLPGNKFDPKVAGPF